MRFVHFFVHFSSPFANICPEVTLIRDQGWINVGVYGLRV